MTNVPDEIRTALADAYKLFDISFKMEGTQEEWEKYWQHGTELVKKYGDDIPVLNLVEAYAKIIECQIIFRQTGNKTLMWEKDEEYPHPRKDKV